MHSYDESKIISDVLRVSEEYCNGNAPTVSQYRQYGKIGMTTVYRNMDGWTSAVREAGLSPHRNRKFDKGDIIDDLKRVSEIVSGSGVTMKNYSENGKYGTGTVRREFGSWNSALEESGLEIVKHTDIDREEIIAELKRISEEHLDGDIPTEDDVKKHCEFSKSPILDTFGKITEAQREAGFKWGRAPPGKGRDTEYGESWTHSLKSEVYERDGYLCAVCGGKNMHGWNPDIHHIKPRKNWDVEEEHEEMNSLDNLVCLCRECHQEFEGQWTECSVDRFIENCKEEMV